MTNPLRDPLALFRFALRERDWPLAGLLALALGGDGRLQPGLERELRSSGRGAPSLGALRTFARLVRALGLERRAD